MGLNPFKLVFLCILVSCFINFATPKTQFTYSDCSKVNVTAGSTYQENVMAILSSLSSKAKDGTTFYNDTVIGKTALDTAYGLFMCRGDVPSQLCGQCVLKATQILSSQCNLSKTGLRWDEECMVRYSKESFFSTVEIEPFHNLYQWDTSQASFMLLLTHTMNKTADGAAFGASRYATNEAYVSENQTLYCLAQCIHTLSPRDCRSCLAYAIGKLPHCCNESPGGGILLPSCSLRYDFYPFYRVNTDARGLVPETKYSGTETETKYSQDPGYLSHDCSSDKDDILQPKLRTLLSYLSSNATDPGNYRFYKTDVDSTVFGLFMCRGDIPLDLCGQCVANATLRIASVCPSSLNAIVWYNHCLLRHSNQPLSYDDASPTFGVLNVTSVNSTEESSFKFLLSDALVEMAWEMWDTSKTYLTRSVRLNDYQSIYILAQCMPDEKDCGRWVYYAVTSTIPWSRLGSVGGRVLYPSFTARFELFQFYRNIGTEHQALHPPPTEKTDRSRPITLIIVVCIIVSVILCCFCCYLLRRKTGIKNYKIILRENFGDEITTLEALQFDLAIIKSATNNFSPDNWIGKGGFGEVYKGILFYGRHIAVKRLSRSSTQGVAEFKNEILLIAKLQHRNLVAFLGFCLEEQEKILIYEYVPNKSLDNFLFDTHSKKLLAWCERLKIIEGIARGIQYLHEYSRLKVIHRDLKPSNVLLDENMNPKFPDFGLAKIVEIDQQKGSTNKIVGTYGYMSPEYAMFGHFSEKSDIFSFGVMVLEIITGKKNLSFH